MFWEKKEDKHLLPDLPPSKIPLNADMFHREESLPEEEEKHSLPSFPDSPNQRGFSQSAIKDAININETEESEDKLEEINEAKEFPEEENYKEVPEDFSENKKFKTVEMEEWVPSSKQTQ